jgi:hypothetical protein
VRPIYRSEIFSLTQKIYVMGSQMQPQNMRAQKSEQILIFELIKDYWHFQISKHYFQSFGFIHVHRKFNCGYATHFLLSMLLSKYESYEIAKKILNSLSLFCDKNDFRRIFFPSVRLLLSFVLPKLNKSSKSLDILDFSMN